jgi:hypothetical protein
MKQLFIVIQLLMIVGFNLNGQNTGVFNISEDIGNPALKGKAVYDNAQQEYTVTGSGYNIWFGRDEFRFLGNKIAGDFILTASFAFEGEGKNAHRKTGWMIRKTVDDNSPHISAVIHGDGLTVMQWRVLKGAYMRDPEDEIFAPKKKYSVLQLERVGDVFIMRAAIAGEPLQVIGKQKLESLEGEVMAGLFVCSHDETVTETARIWNVRIDKPMPASSNSYSGEVALSRLETLSINTFRRNVVLASDKKFEAPNWMPDGKRLLFNMEGLLYTIPAGGGDLEKLNTGSATRNNNDHGISFDGKCWQSAVTGKACRVEVRQFMCFRSREANQSLLQKTHRRTGMAGRPTGKRLYMLPREATTLFTTFTKRTLQGERRFSLPTASPGSMSTVANTRPTESLSGSMQAFRAPCSYGE